MLVSWSVRSVLHRHPPSDKRHRCNSRSIYHVKYKYFVIPKSITSIQIIIKIIENKKYRNTFYHLIHIYYKTMAKLRKTLIIRITEAQMRYILAATITENKTKSKIIREAIQKHLGNENR